MSPEQSFRGRIVPAPVVGQVGIRRLWVERGGDASSQRGRIASLASVGEAVSPSPRCTPKPRPVAAKCAVQRLIGLTASHLPRGRQRYQAIRLVGVLESRRENDHHATARNGTSDRCGRGPAQSRPTVDTACSGHHRKLFLSFGALFGSSSAWLVGNHTGFMRGSSRTVRCGRWRVLFSRDNKAVPLKSLPRARCVWLHVFV